MSTLCRIALLDDLPRLVDLMTDFYMESGFRLDRQRSKVAFEVILLNPSLGRIWVLERDERSIGYMVLTLGFSMEYGGRDAFLDDLFIEHDYRGAGLGKMALKAFFDACDSLGVRAAHLEVDRANFTAKTLYEKFGFKDNDRQLFTCRLEDPL